MVTKKGTANYETAELELIPNGELVTTANGQTVFIRRAGGVKHARLTLSGHFLSYPAGVYTIGETFEYLGVTFVVEGFQTSGHPLIEGSNTPPGDKDFDGRAYTITARSVQALTTTAFEQLKAGLS